ncbi:MAG: hypothetical protein EB107_14010 [Proteobacteria bacterium]|nr:hypothetical protein [Pseudomonadota bacterium]
MPAHGRRHHCFKCSRGGFRSSPTGRLAGRPQGPAVAPPKGRSATGSPATGELLRQIAAVRAALDATAKIILADHIESCLHGAVEGGDAEVAWADLRTALETFIR